MLCLFLDTLPIVFTFRGKKATQNTKVTCLEYLEMLFSKIDKIDDKIFNITTFEVNGFRLHSWKGLASLDKPRSSATAAECGLLVSKIIN